MMNRLRRARGLLLVLAISAPPAAALHEGAAPLKVFVLVGQSNMQGHAQVRTLDVMAKDKRTAPLLAKVVDEDGTPRVCEDVWISSLGSAAEERSGPLTVGFGAEARGPKIGPELTFGITMHEHLGEPILIIKTAWGGRSLHTDFRPPSAGAHAFREDQLAGFEKQGKDVAALKAERAEATGRNYRAMVEHVQSVLADIRRVVPGHRKSQGYELAGLVWFQGWNDMVDRGAYPQRDRPGGYDAYSEVFAHFVHDVRKDLEAPKLPVVIGVLGVGGPTEHYGPDQQRYKGLHQSFRDAMAAPASMSEFKGTVAAVRTERFWDLEITELRRRDRALNAERKRIDADRDAGKLKPDEAKEAREALRAEEFTEDELYLLDNSCSNAEFHYLGSAKIMTQIGVGFAEAMVDLLGDG